MKPTLKTYYALTKPGIIYGNDVMAIGAFFLAARGHSTIVLFLAMIAGISFVIGSACVFNNYLDRDIDAKMQRTKDRAMATHAISTSDNLIFGTLIGLLGLLLLYFGTNPLTALIAFFGFFMYVAVYTPVKRLSVHGTLVGSISGAVPPVVGYCAVTGKLDLEAFILFVILVFWQMPHFYAIAMYRLRDYTEAGIPVLPAVSGMHATKIQIVGYIMGLVIAVSSLTFFGFAGYAYLTIAIAVCLAWLYKGLAGFTEKDINDAAWARSMFFFSLVVIMALCGAMSLNHFLF
jgi:protoheme IX farnesyltransferase